MNTPTPTTIEKQLKSVDRYIWSRAWARYHHEKDVCKPQDLHDAAVAACVEYLTKRPYDASKGASVLTYLRKRINGAMADEQRLAAPVHVPESDKSDYARLALRKMDNTKLSFNQSEWTVESTDLIETAVDSVSLNPEEEAIANEQYAILEDVLESNPDFRLVWEAKVDDENNRGDKAVAKTLGAGWTEYRVRQVMERITLACRTACGGES